MSPEVQGPSTLGQAPSTSSGGALSPSKGQRLRLTFAKKEEVKHIAHLDLMRLWERALRRAEVPLARSQGYNPHPFLALAAPLPLGVTSQNELLDIILCEPMSPDLFLQRIRRQLPPGIELLEVQEVGLKLRSLPSQVRYAEYRVTIEADRPIEEIEEGLR
ncbi:MAG: TIGR03936 family radical SAM-associated protein, partial [Chloroflexota bacterium]|nr:TIGR03936 family radical SAM-associated protein [Chloroflexota bacterium]